MDKLQGRFHYNKFLIRITVILSVVLIFIMLLGYLINYNYRDKAIKILKNFLDKQLTTEIHVRKSDISFSFLRHFPKAGIEFNNVLIKSAPGITYKDFLLPCEDTLMFANNISFVIDMKSFITHKYLVNRIEISDAKLNLLIDAKGNTNYNIIREKPDSTGNDTLRIDLKRIQLKNIKTLYVDRRINMVLAGTIPQALLSGSFTEEDFRVASKGSIRNTWLDIDHTNYLKRQGVIISLIVTKTGNEYKFSNGTFNLSGLEMMVNGYWNDIRNYYNFSLSTDNARLDRVKQPAVTRYLGKTGLIPTRGNVKLRAKVSGFSGAIPHIDVRFISRNAGFRNRQKDIDIKDLYVKGSYTNGSMRNRATSLLKIDSLSARTNNSNFSTAFTAGNFNSLNLTGHVTGIIELSDLKLIDALSKRLELKGVVNTAITFRGIIPSIEHFKVKDLNYLNLNGHLDFADIKVHSLINSFPEAIVTGNIDFNTFQRIYLKDVLLKVGNSALTVNGEVSNLPLFSDKQNIFPVYKIKVKSPEIHVEDFLIRSDKIDKEKQFKVAFPDSLVIYAGIDFQKFYFGKFSASDVKGDLSYIPKKLSISGFSMQTLQGNITSSVDVTQQNGKLLTQCDASLNHLNIEKMFNSFNNFGQSVINSDNLKGFLSGTASVTSAWDLNLKPLLDQLSMESSVKIVDGELINYQPLMGLSNFIAVDELKDIHFAELNCNILIRQRTIYFSQTDIHSSAIDLTASGQHRFDNSYDYHFQVGLSDLLWKKARKKKPENTEFGYIVDDNTKEITIPLEVKGKGTKFKVYHDKVTARNRLRLNLLKQKKELKELFNSSDSEGAKVDSTEGLPKFEWEDQDRKEKKEERKKIKDTKKEEKNTDFKVKWDDE